MNRLYLNVALGPIGTEVERHMSACDLEEVSP